MTGAQTTQTTPSYYEPASALADREQHRLRVLIDEVATTRGLTIQMALRLMSLAAAPDEAEQLQMRAEFRVLHDQFKANMQMLFGTSAATGDNRAHIEWIRTTVRANTRRRALLLEAETHIASVARSLDAGRIPSFAEARQFFDKSWPVIRDKMTEVIWDLWADLDVKRNRAIDESAALQTTLQTTLADIKRFSSAIRMIAINTSVLATRPQESRAGFQAISKEVKKLSEDIDSCTNRAREAISGLRL